MIYTAFLLLLLLQVCEKMDCIVLCSTGEKLYMCKWCGMYFIQSGCVGQYVVLCSTGEKPYMWCEMSFIQ